MADLLHVREPRADRLLSPDKFVGTPAARPTPTVGVGLKG